ncbi:hypothetical protein KAR91_36210 [Candidatus Pacearchaeota archaeon]|nr:hypothetical protein [Candidatus Pacearchaeota archaeon]
MENKGSERQKDGVKAVCVDEGVSKPRFISIEGGGDWADASVEYMILLGDYNLEELHKEYCDAGSYQGTKLFFGNWLVEKEYAREAKTDKDFQSIYD